MAENEVFSERSRQPLLGRAAVTKMAPF